MPKRRKLPLGKAKFVDAILRGDTKFKAAKENLDVRPAPSACYQQGEEQSVQAHHVYQAADLALRDERVGNALIEKLRKYQATWADLEVGMRAVMARHLSGVGLDELEPAQREALASAAARAVMQALAKNPEAFAESARKEDEARETLPALARRFLGAVPVEPKLPASEAPEPRQGEPS